MTRTSVYELTRAQRKAELLERAASLCRAREFTRALECFDELIRSFPYDVEVLCEFARRAHEMGAERLACGLLSSAARQRPDNPEILVSLAKAFVRVRALENAEALFEQALRADPRNGPAHAGMVHLHACRGEFRRARDHYEEIAGVNRDAGRLAAQELANVPVQKAWRDLSSKNSLLAELGAGPRCIGDSSGIVALTVPLLSGDECADLAGAVQAHAGHAATVSEGAIDGTARQGMIHWLAWPDVNPQTARKLIAFAEEARRRFAIRGIDQFERVQISRYSSSGGGHFDWHQDSEDLPQATVRKLSVSVQLSPASSYEGGELELRGGDGVIGVPRAQGCGVAFRSSLIHRVTPVTQGVRWSMVWWARGPVGGFGSNIKLLN
ncbi:MAG: 2OG-Fe(II) oxygenase [Alphaproteobacteria bacterium]